MSITSPATTSRKRRRDSIDHQINSRADRRSSTETTKKPRRPYLHLTAAALLPCSQYDSAVHTLADDVPSPDWSPSLSTSPPPHQTPARDPETIHPASQKTQHPHPPRPKSPETPTKKQNDSLITAQTQSAVLEYRKQITALARDLAVEREMITLERAVDSMRGWKASDRAGLGGGD